MKKLLALALMTSLMPVSGVFAKDVAFEQDFDRWIVRLRAIDMHPDPSSSVTGLNASVRADNNIMPEVDFTYFWTKNIATELILATTKHEMSTNTGVDLGDTWVLPPQLTMQYHPFPDSPIRPYVGAGVGYIMYYGGDSGAVNSVKYDDGISYTLQLGMDVELEGPWALNFDIKKVYHQTDVSINGGAITADVDLDPWVIGGGIAYRF